MGAGMRAAAVSAHWQFCRLHELPSQTPEQHTPSAQKGGQPPEHPPLGLVATEPRKHCETDDVPDGHDVGSATHPEGGLAQLLTMVAPAGIVGVLALRS
jgi:hypothetical protein